MQKKKMKTVSEQKNWNNLLRDRCPMCAYELRKQERQNPHYPQVRVGSWICVNPDCRFTIGNEKKQELVDKIKQDFLSAGVDIDGESTIQVDGDSIGEQEAVMVEDADEEARRYVRVYDEEAILDPDGNYKRLMEL